ncbi:MAG: FAD-linked oxidase C-terminal domain-containing protein, partial [Planctomycetia bacterium]
VATWSELANQLFPEAFLQAHAGNGIVFGHIQGLDLKDTKNGLNQLMEKAVRYQGNMVLHRCPDSWQEELPLWGTLREDLELMRKVKQAMDPLGLFNPGRFVGRI